MSAASAAPGAWRAPAPSTAINSRRLIAFLLMVIGMFMAILDIQIVSASLAEIQAGLSASAEEISWVQTAYLIAEVVMIPLSGLLSRAISTRWMFAISAAGFTVMSILCGLAQNIEQMIIFRALQGFIGGGMIPTVFASAFAIFPPDKRGIVNPLIGLIATLAPTIGPTLGGYLTDALSWHWLFFINIVPGIVVTISTIMLVDFDEPDWSLLKTFDWWGLAFMALFLCSLEYVLEEGPAKDWFTDNRIVTFTVLTVLGAILFFWRTLSARFPIVDLSAFADRNFWTGCLFSFVLGIGLYGLTYIYPVFLSRARGYSSLQIGETMFVTGATMFVSAPIVGRLLGVMDNRAMLALGLTIFSAGTWLTTGITRDWAFGELFIPQICRGFGLMCCMLPINNLALGTLPPQRLKNASGIYNLTRNLGGAVGLALINTLLNKRLDLHLARLHEQVSQGSIATQNWLETVRRSMAGTPDGGLTALRQLSRMVRGQATVMAFADLFVVLTLMFLALLPLIVLIRKPAPRKAPVGGH
jgi:MFS transporter, DHA2 family, multidrug resistance protein